MSSEKKINIPERIFEKILEEDKDLQKILAKALIRALEDDHVQFVVNLSVPQLINAMFYTYKEMISPIVERAVIKALQSIKQQQ